MKTIFPIRLKQARTMKGLSLDALSQKTEGALTKQAISKYELGKMLPDSTSLIALAKALELPIDYLLRPIQAEISHVEFRKKAKLGKLKSESIIETVKDKAERYIQIEQVNGLQQQFVSLIDRVRVSGEDDIAPIVANIKRAWLLGEDGINNLIEILEEHQIKVIEIDAPDAFDGLSCWINEQVPIIVLNKNYNSERKRFTALHELGHILIRFDESVSEKQIEYLCNLFASEMLISRVVMMQKLGENRKDISLRELIDIQMQYGISVDALMYKAKQLNIITENRYLTFCKKKGKLQKFNEEVMKSRYKDEPAGRFERLVYRALASELITVSKASSLLGIPVSEVMDHLNLV